MAIEQSAVSAGYEGEGRSPGVGGYRWSDPRPSQHPDTGLDSGGQMPEAKIAAYLRDIGNQLDWHRRSISDATDRINRQDIALAEMRGFIEFASGFSPATFDAYARHMLVKRKLTAALEG